MPPQARPQLDRSLWASPLLSTALVLLYGCAPTPTPGPLVPQAIPAPSGSQASTAPAPQAPSVREAMQPHNEALTRQAVRGLRRTLQTLSQRPAIALGHEDTTAYGVGWKSDEDRSDVKSICGSHVAVFGWDVFGLEVNASANGDGVDFGEMRQLIERAYAQGGIITISWHSHNPVSGGDAWDTSPAVPLLLAGGSHHASFVAYLDKVANFLQELRGPQGELIPIIFRPYHEHTGHWFWWGKTRAAPGEYRALWRLTVDHFKARGLFNLLYAFSPSGGDVTSTEGYFYAYPGDDYVDLFGADYYYINDSAHLVQLAETLVDVAAQRGKIPALTEFGPRGGVHQFLINKKTWFGSNFLKPLASSPKALGLAYALAWRNAREDHAFLPYPGHPGQADLDQACNSPELLLLSDLQPQLSGPAEPMGPGPHSQ